MFKGSNNVRPDQHPSWITSIGGESNAETDEDATIYWQTVPAHYLPLALWLEADRMASLEVSEEKFKTELEVVKEERRMRFENQPFGRLPEIIFDKAFTTHPYKHQTIGSLRGPRSGVDPATCASSTRPTTCRTTRRSCSSATSRRKQAQQLVEQYLGRVPKGQAGAARHPDGAAAHDGVSGAR